MSIQGYRSSDQKERVGTNALIYRAINARRLHELAGLGTNYKDRIDMIIAQSPSYAHAAHYLFSAMKNWRNTPINNAQRNAIKGITFHNGNYWLGRGANDRLQKDLNSIVTLADQKLKTNKRYHRIKNNQYGATPYYIAIRNRGTYKYILMNRQRGSLYGVSENMMVTKL